MSSLQNRFSWCKYTTIIYSMTLFLVTNTLFYLTFKLKNAIYEKEYLDVAFLATNHTYRQKRKQ